MWPADTPAPSSIKLLDLHAACVADEKSAARNLPEILASAESEEEAENGEEGVVQRSRLASPTLPQSESMTGAPRVALPSEDPAYAIVGQPMTGSGDGNMSLSSTVDFGVQELYATAIPSSQRAERAGSQPLLPDVGAMDPPPPLPRRSRAQYPPESAWLRVPGLAGDERCQSLLLVDEFSRLRLHCVLAKTCSASVQSERGPKSQS